MKIFYTVCFSLLFCISCSSCGRGNGLTFDSEWYVGDPVNERIISDAGNTVACYENNFKKYVCLHEEDLGRLIALLQQASIKKKEKLNVLEFIRKALKR